RQSLIGWHHYSIVCKNAQPSVYVDGNDNTSELSVANTFLASVFFQPTFGRTRGEWSFRTPLAGPFGAGFEGWISELRLSSIVMRGGEALTQINNASMWDYVFPMSGCSGENHTGSGL